MFLHSILPRYFYFILILNIKVLVFIPLNTYSVECDKPNDFFVQNVQKAIFEIDLNLKGTNEILFFQSLNCLLINNDLNFDKVVFLLSKNNIFFQSLFKEFQTQEGGDPYFLIALHYLKEKNIHKYILMMMMGFYAEDQFQLNNDQAFVVVATLLTFTYMGVTAPGFQGISAGARLGTIAGYPPDYLVWLASEIGKKNKKHLTADSFYDLTVSNVQELILNAYWNNIGLINLVRSFRYIEMSKDEDLTELASNLINEIIQFKLDQNNKRILRSK